MLDPATVKITPGALEQYIRVFHGIRHVNPEAAPTYESDMRRALERILRYWNDGYGHDAPLPGPDHTLWLVSANRRACHGRLTAVWRRKP
jgi:plasmid stabilization system protein ParE